MANTFTQQLDTEKKRLTGGRQIMASPIANVYIKQKKMADSTYSSPKRIYFLIITKDIFRIFHGQREKNNSRPNIFGISFCSNWSISIKNT